MKLRAKRDGDCPRRTAVEAGFKELHCGPLWPGFHQSFSWSY